MEIEEKNLLNLFYDDQHLMTIVKIIRELNLQDSWLAAGSVRNFIWNHLSGREKFDFETDIDVIFFDPTVSYEETLQIEKRLREAHPLYSWEVKNQVYMHIHSPNTKPYTSSQDAMSRYPETCTALGLRLLKNDYLELFTAYGLTDLVNFQVKPTLHFLADEERIKLYRERLEKKKWQSKWPRLDIYLPEKET